MSLWLLVSVVYLFSRSWLLTVSVFSIRQVAVIAPIPPWVLYLSLCPQTYRFDVSRPPVCGQAKPSIFRPVVRDTRYRVLASSSRGNNDATGRFTVSCTWSPASAGGGVTCPSSQLESRHSDSYSLPCLAIKLRRKQSRLAATRPSQNIDTLLC